MGEERTHYDASGIIRLIHHSGSEYDIEGQGTSVYSLIDMYPRIYEMTAGVYKIGGTAHGTTKYLSDGESNLDEEISWPRDAGGAGATQRQRWSIFPVADSYFGIKPTVEVNGTYYATIYGDFPFSTQSAGMKLYTVTKTGQGMAAVHEITGTVPQATPLLVECKGATPSDNRLNIGATPTATINGNLLNGVYFENTFDKRHWNTVNYDKETMRVLGLTASGEPGFITAGDDLKYIPANTAYIKVQPGTDAELRIVSEEEYEQSAGIEITTADADTPVVSITVEGLTVSLSCTDADVEVEILDLAGHTVARAVTPSVVTLSAHGLYIVRTPAGSRKLLL